MRRALGKLMLVWLIGCGADRLPARGTENGPTLLTAGCETDESCPAGMVCEGCNGALDATCVPGCRADAQCPPRHVCRAPVVCTSCPCAPGWCELDPCRDDDGDGFAFTNEPGLTCPGKQKGDCNDGRREQHPGALELCANSSDDDCDGKTDRYDESCQQCTAQSLRCDDAWVCAAGGQLGSVRCEGGCCQSCPLLEPKRCGTNQISVGGGLDPITSCRAEQVCIDWQLCANTSYDPVCSLTFASFRNPCVAQAAQATVLHRGNCQWGEGRPCASGPEVCERGQFCRLDAAAGRRCTLDGTCVTEADCPAGLATPCGGGPVRWSCEQHQCLARCE